MTSLNIIRNLTCKEKYTNIQMCNGYLCMSVCVYIYKHIYKYFSEDNLWFT